MSSKTVKYDIAAKQEVAALLECGEKAISAGKEFQLGNNTTLPAAKRFTLNESNIMKLLTSLSATINKDANDAASAFEAIAQTDVNSSNLYHS